MNEVISDSTWKLRVITENFEGITSNLFNPSFCSKPHKSFFVLQTANGCIVRKTIFYLVLSEKVLLALENVGGRNNMD
jgi:hypothetical protein